MAKERRSLNGKVVAITGGARGIGKATAAALVRKGCRVAIGDLDLELAERTAAELGGGTIASRLDVTDRASFAAFLDEAERQLGPLDVLVNNAGIMPVTPFDQESDDSIRRQLEINVYGVIAGMQLAIERMQARATPATSSTSPPRRAKRASPGSPPTRPPSTPWSGSARPCGPSLRQRSRARLRDADRRQHRADRRPRPSRASQAGRGRGRRQRDRRRARSAALRRLRAARQLAPLFMVVALLPRRAREALGRLMGVDMLMTEVDHAARAATRSASHRTSPSAESEQERPSTTPPEPRWDGSTTRPGGGPSRLSTTAL